MLKVWKCSNCFPGYLAWIMPYYAEYFLFSCISFPPLFLLSYPSNRPPDHTHMSRAHHVVPAGRRGIWKRNQQDEAVSECTAIFHSSCVCVHTIDWFTHTHRMYTMSIAPCTVMWIFTNVSWFASVWFASKRCLNYITGISGHVSSFITHSYKTSTVYVQIH